MDKHKLSAEDIWYFIEIWGVRVFNTISLLAVAIVMLALATLLMKIVINN